MAAAKLKFVFLLKEHFRFSLSEVPLLGSSGLAAPEIHSGTPFVLRGAPSLPGQPDGGSSFGNFNSQQNSAFVARAVSSVDQRPFFKPPSMVSHHFQLASANAFGGTNPFSPSLSGRTRSMDGFGEPKAIEQTPRAQSAPIVPQMSGESCFLFPSKSNPQFYLPRIKVGMLIYHFQVKFDVCKVVAIIRHFILFIVLFVRVLK